MNPIIVNYEYDKNKFHVCPGKVFKKTFKNTHFQENNSIDIESTYTNIPYSVTYDYHQFSNFKFSMMTDFLPLKHHSVSYKNKFDKCVSFGLDIDRTNTIHTKFIDALISMVETIQKLICSDQNFSQHSINFSFPYGSMEDSKEFVMIYLKSAKKTTNPANIANPANYTHYNICPISFHRSKSKGGNIITINNDNVENTPNIINKEMPMFKNSFYMKKSIDPKYAERENIYYVGKFVLEFDVEFLKYEIPSTGSQNFTCKIRLVATEMEIKHNVSKCPSILSNDVISIDIKDKSNNTLTI